MALEVICHHSGSLSADKYLYIMAKLEGKEGGRWGGLQSPLVIVAAQVSYMEITTASTAASSAVEQSCCSVGGRAAPEEPFFSIMGLKE